MDLVGHAGEHRRPLQFAALGEDDRQEIQDDRQDLRARDHGRDDGEGRAAQLLGSLPVALGQGHVGERRSRQRVVHSRRLTLDCVGGLLETPTCLHDIVPLQG